MEQKNNFFENIRQKKYEIGSICIFLGVFGLITFFFFSRQTEPKMYTKKEAQEMVKKQPTIYPDTPANFPNRKKLSFTNMEENAEYSNIWGEENMKISENGVHAIYPKGSFSPSNGDIKGGGGFIYTPKELSASTHTELSYTLTFADNFNFVKGGKLPGLCGGECPRGGNEGEGFSTRFMWRRDGDLEVYAYFSGLTEQSIERGMFRFETGRKYHISQEITINTPGKEDGTLKVFVDGKCIYKNTTMSFRTTSDVLPNRVIFSTFFGGADKTWATPVTTSIDFGDFTLGWE